VVRFSWPTCTSRTATHKTGTLGLPLFISDEGGRSTAVAQRAFKRAVPNAFNSTPALLAYVEAAALCSIPLVLLDLASAIRRVGASLDAIRSELEIANVARVQSWGHGGFGAYVHRFVQNNMTAVNGAQDEQHHFFYVWHPDSDWYPSLEGRQTQNPLVLRSEAIIMIS
jgi:hypothetical protein